MRPAGLRMVENGELEVEAVTWLGVMRVDMGLGDERRSTSSGTEKDGNIRFLPGGFNRLSDNCGMPVVLFAYLTAYSEITPFSALGSLSYVLPNNVGLEHEIPTNPHTVFISSHS